MHFTINSIIEAIRKHKVKITEHADEEATNDELTFEEIFFSVMQGEIIENYSDDKPYPSCLVYGNTFNSQPVHSVWAYNPENEWVVLITVYRPDKDLWINWKERKKRK